jgi:hypothetical protein
LEIIYEMLHGLTPKLRARILQQTLGVRHTLTSEMDMTDEDTLTIILAICLSNMAMLGVDHGDMIRLVARTYNLPPLYVCTHEQYDALVARAEAGDEKKDDTPPHTDDKGNTIH